jgi:hypothetical protein
LSLVNRVQCDVLVVGGGLGGVAAAMGAACFGLRVVLTEETFWIGGQLTSQAVPPDEHPWIEEFGCTALYRRLRNEVRNLYLAQPGIRADLPTHFNPGGGWVSKITARPDAWRTALENLIGPYVEDKTIQILYHTVVSGGAQLSNPPKPDPFIAADVDGDRIRSVSLLHLKSGELTTIQANWFVDATELGDLLPLTGTEYVTGAESSTVTGERHAARDAQPENQQALTWVFAMNYSPGTVNKIREPEGYVKWRHFRIEGWPGPILELQDLDPVTNLPRVPPLPLISDSWRCWFKYRQVVNPDLYSPPKGPATTIVNWPQNDYFLDPIIDVDPQTRWDRLTVAKELSLCLLYYLQTECPRPDGGLGYPELSLTPEGLGSEDGFALTPYIRESRRIVSKETILESQISGEDNPGKSIAPAVLNSVGVGSYRIDLHPSTGGDLYVDLATLPFQIPLGAMVPVHMKNLIPACKNIGTTHVTNGCYRLHPVEWNIGEVAGYLAAFCSRKSITPADVFDSPQFTQEFQALIVDQGVETEWQPEKMTR